MKEEPNARTTRDSQGYLPDLELIGTNWRHTGNNHIYRLTGYRWYGDDDLWLISFERVEKGTGTLYSRSIKNFHEDRQGKPRFEQVWGLRSATETTYVNAAEIKELEKIEKSLVPYMKAYSMAAFMPQPEALRSQTKEEIEQQAIKIRNMDGYD